jgi:hypothetical protein
MYMEVLYYMYLKGIGCEGVTLTHLAQDTAQWRDKVNTAMNLPSSIKDGKFLTNLATVSFSR